MKLPGFTGRVGFRYHRFIFLIDYTSRYKVLVTSEGKRGEEVLKKESTISNVEDVFLWEVEPSVHQREKE